MEQHGKPGGAQRGYSDIVGRAGIVRALVMAVIGLGLTACAPGPESAMDVTYLPEGTPRLSASEQRAIQLRTGSYHDDIPEYTGAPGINARWPAYVPQLHTTVYRGEDTRIRKD